MIDLAPLPSFVAVSLVVILAPSSDVLLLIRASLLGGKRLGFATFAGVHVGNLVLTLLVASGLGAVVAQHTNVLRAIQMVGGLYLLWLAWGAARSVRALVRARRSGAAVATHDLTTPTTTFPRSPRLSNTAPARRSLAGS